MNLSNISKNIRASLKISQKKLADMIGTNQTKISFIEAGFIPPQKELIEKLHKLHNETK